MSDDFIEIEKLLKSTSIKAFIKYYEKFENDLEESDFIALFKAQENWKSSSYKTIITSGKKIFSKGLNEQTLLYVINKNKRIDDEIIYQAKKLLKKIEQNRLKIDRKLTANLISDEDMYWLMKDYEEENKIIFGR